MKLPDYRGGSIVNLMQSIAGGFGGVLADAAYPPLALAPADLFGAGRKVVLLVVDGLGHEFLVDQAADGAMHALVRGGADVFLEAGKETPTPPVGKGG